MSREEEDVSTNPINIPETHINRQSGTSQLSNIAQSFAGTLQSWTANYGRTASTYMSDNIAVPASYVADNLTENGTFGATSSRNQHGSLFSTPAMSSINPNNHLTSQLQSPTNTIYHTPASFFSNLGSIAEHGGPSNFTNNNRHHQYGSILSQSVAPNLSPIVDDDDNSSLDMFGTSYVPSHHGSILRSGERRPLKINYPHPERTPLIRTVSKSSSITSVPVSDIIDIPYTVGSTFRQSIFNSCNILIGIGILALPLGFRYAGWVIGLTLFTFCLFVTNYTAKILAKCLSLRTGMNTYADMGAAAFGEKSRFYISALFSLELLASSTALVILCGDSLHALFPDTSIVYLKICAWVVMTPLTLIAIRYLSYFSLMGILSAIMLVNVLIIDGVSKDDRPGSLVVPMETSLWPDWGHLPMSFGLIMAGFTGHAVFPSVYKDMQNPKQYTKMVNITYSVTALVYFLMAVCGYLMFGELTMQEITQNLMLIPQYNGPLNKFIIWMVIFNPLAKYALTLNPINLTLEITYSSFPRVESWCNSGRGRRTALRLFSRIMLSTIVLFIAIQFPGFDRVMGILGSFFSYTISAIFPCVCHLKLFGRKLKTKYKKTSKLTIPLLCNSLSGELNAFDTFTNKMGHLDLEVAKGLIESCYLAYNTSLSGIGPEEFMFPYKTSDDNQPSYDYLSSTIESLFVMYRVTGDNKYQDMGWNIWM
ncbi:13438_t:CDS:2, partial [Entrophospora sp. SA101]